MNEQNPYIVWIVGLLSDGRETDPPLTMQAEW